MPRSGVRSPFAPPGKLQQDQSSWPVTAERRNSVAAGPHCCIAATLSEARDYLHAPAHARVADPITHMEFIVMKLFLPASLFMLGSAMLMAPAQAAPVTPVQQAAADFSNLRQDAASRNYNNNNNRNYNNNNNHRQMRKSWNRNRDGARCRSRSGSCRHYHNGYWYANPWWTLPLIGGSIILNAPSPSSGSRHQAWCEDKYRSYNPRTNTWLSYSGEVRQCVSPYRS